MEAMSSADVPGVDEDDDDDEGGLFDLKKLQANLSESINQGYMESVKHLRDMLMAYEWDLHGKELAGRRWAAGHCHDARAHLASGGRLLACVNKERCQMQFSCQNVKEGDTAG